MAGFAVAAQNLRHFAQGRTNGSTLHPWRCTAGKFPSHSSAMPATPFNIFIALVELSLLAWGVVLLWRQRSRVLAQPLEPAALPAWNISVSDFLLFTLVIIAGGLLASFITGLVLGQFTVSTDTKTILASAAFQFGLLLGPAILPLRLGHHPLSPPLDRATLLSGAGTFLIALPIVTVVQLAWLGTLKLSNLPAEQQDLLRMFKEVNSPALIIILIVLATLVAPVTEELLFRATLFRYLRTRVPTWVALLLPGTIFAALHVNWITLDGLASFVPLITLAVIFSIAYTRTGRIGTAMVAHGLFNLHTILLLFTGVTS